MSKERVLDAESVRTMYTLYSTFVVPDLGRRHTAMSKQHSLFRHDQSLKARTIGSIILARRRTWTAKDGQGTVFMYISHSSFVDRSRKQTRLQPALALGSTFN
ncbi:unnamed protein product [Ixodes pacificus]